MPSAYVLAKDSLQQAQAILSNEVWQDDQVDHLLGLAIARLLELEHQHLEEDFSRAPTMNRVDPHGKVPWFNIHLR
jgi:hypothetical protein